MTEQLEDKVILWIDDSPESKKARELLNQTGIDYQERTPNQTDPDDFIEPPILQGYLYRYSGLILIQALTENPHFTLKQHLELEREQYQTLIKFEEGLRDLSPEGISRLWPRWSKRWRPYNPRLNDS